jgi:hypothetical protein
MITEEQKQEADRIVDKHIKAQGIISYPKWKHLAYKTAIQDRQSVLDEVTGKHSYTFKKRIQSLTNQIGYLKTKI